MGTRGPGHRELRTAGAGRVVNRHVGPDLVRTHSRLPFAAVLCAALALAGCQQSVMVRPVKGVSDAPPQSRPTRSYAGRVHTVQSGDTLYKISLQYGVDYRDIAKWNAIDAPYTIYPRQSLRLDAEDRVASEPPPREPRRPRAASPTSPAPPETTRNSDGVTMTALPDDLPSAAPATVASATPKSVPPTAVLSEEPEPMTRMPVTTTATPGAAIDTGPPPATSSIVADPSMQHRASTGSEDGAVLAEAPSLPPPPVAPMAQRPAIAPIVPPAAVGTPSPTIAAVKPTAASADIESARASASGWIWPTPGRVVVTYAGGDPTRQGIDIAGTLGQPVRVARDGEVVYSGAGLIGYGELIIVKHSPELLSAYGHNRVRLVKEGEKLKAGQKIAEMGKNAANRVLLHFEVRKGGKPIDPLPLLPAQ